ncbi:MAG: HAMP domain-containing protein [Planctomycetes bacterium]|nr:HAMP domain-containing protein [Planctomycetota bacterium]
MLRIGLRHRIALFVGISPAVLALATGAFLVDRQHEKVEELLTDRYQARARLLGIYLAEPAPNPAGELMLAEVAEDRSIVLVEFFDAKGSRQRTIAGAFDGVEAEDIRASATGQDGPASTVEEIAPYPGGLLHVRGHFIAVTVPVGEGGGWVRLLFCTRTENEELDRIAWTALAIILCGLFLGLGLALRLDRGLRRVIANLSRVTQEISTGKLDRRLQVRTGDDLEHLGDLFNHMAASLSAAQEALDAKNKELANLLERRTRALQVAKDMAAHHEEMAATGLLAAGVAHEIGNPLSSISGIAQRLRADHPDPEVTARCESILDVAHRIERILRDLRTFAWPDGDARLTAVEVGQIVRDLVQLAGSKLEGGDIEFRLDEEPGVPPVTADADRLRQVFLNIAINAIEAMSGQGVLSVRVARAGEEVLVAFRDTGIGMTPEVARQIFNPFFSTKNEERRRNSGLGLAISSAIIQRLGGRIDVASSPGVGSTFTVFLPAATRALSPPATRALAQACPERSEGAAAR